MHRIENTDIKQRGQDAARRRRRDLGVVHRHDDEGHRHDDVDAACLVLPCARRSSPLVAASGMAAVAWAAWLIVGWHAPWYTTYKAHYREAECMRVEMEELLYAYGVDVVFTGHVSLALAPLLMV